MRSMNILVFDGYCHFCQFWVRQLIRADRKQVLKLVSFEELNRVYPGVLKPGQAPDSLWFINKQKVYSQSDAVTEALIAVGQPCKVLGTMIGYIPRWLRNLAYRFIARYRYFLFGKHDTCPMPRPEHRRHYLTQEELLSMQNEMPALPLKG
jgi:predicted DCC family thiol-disulfide oxidoreductase YuxK